MKKIHIRSAQTVVEMWNKQQSGMSVRDVSRSIGLSYNSVNRWLSEVQQALNGTPVWKLRKKGQKALEMAVKKIQANYIATETVPASEVNAVEHVQPGVDVETRLNKAWEELQVSITEFIKYEVRSRVERDNKALFEQNEALMAAAKNSNIVGFIRKGLN